MVALFVFPSVVSRFQMSPPASGNSHPSRGSSITQHMSQHKRSQSFNHHLSYNQVQHQQSQKQLLANFAARNSDQSQQQPVPNLKGIKEKGINSIPRFQSYSFHHLILFFYSVAQLTGKSPTSGRPLPCGRRF